MTIKSLPVGTVRLYFDGTGVAQFEAKDETRASVETLVGAYRDFIDRWLEASEETRPRYITEEERELRATLRRIAKDLSRGGMFDTEFIKTVIQEVATYQGQRSSSLTPTQISESVKDAISSL